MKTKKWMACLLAAVFVLGMLCTPAFAAEEPGNSGDPSGTGSAAGDDAGDLPGTGSTDGGEAGGTDETGEPEALGVDDNVAGEISHDLSTGGSLVIEKDGTYRVTQSDVSTPTGNNITVTAGAKNATVILAGVNIKSGCAFRINYSPGNITVELEGGTVNTLVSTNTGAAGLQAGMGATVSDANLTITGDGSLSATGGREGSGIGGGWLEEARNIIIKGNVVVTAANGDSKSNGAGIGATRGSANRILITDNAKVTATGGGSEVGIGGNGIDFGITISGNAQVTATGGSGSPSLGWGGAGIGGGTARNITITDNAQVTAVGGPCAAGIGGGYDGNAYNISIAGNAKVTADGGFGGEGYGVGIGGGVKGNGEKITIANLENVRAGGIGGGYKGRSLDISIGSANNDGLCAHGNLEYYPAQEATQTADGNIEYWYCRECGKYFTDAALTQEVTKEDVIVADVRGADGGDSDTEDNAGETAQWTNPNTGDGGGIALWLSLMPAAGAALAAAAASARKRTVR